MVFGRCSRMRQRSVHTLEGTALAPETFTLKDEIVAGSAVP